MTLSPSATPNTTVMLPLASHVRRDALAAQVRVAATAEHEPQLTRPTTRDLFVPDGPS